MREEERIIRHALCLFEYTSDALLQRHTTPAYVAVSKNSYLVLRNTAVVGNYDYTIDYIFYLDGSMEVKFRASGFIQGAYYVPDQSDNHGYRVHDQFASSMHDHVLNFKADFDVLGPSNTLVSVDIEPAKIRYPWSPGESRDTILASKLGVDARGLEQ